MLYNKVHSIVIAQQNDKEPADNRYEHTNILYDKQQYWLRMPAVIKMFKFTFNRNKEGKKASLLLYKETEVTYLDFMILTSLGGHPTLYIMEVRLILTISRGKSIMPECLPEDADPAVQ